MSFMNTDQKNLQQNTNKLNPAIYKKDYPLQPS